MSFYVWETRHEKGANDVEKVLITAEQANAIELCVSKEQLIVARATGLLQHGRDEGIDELTIEELVRALYIGYEIEPEYKVGDWVLITDKDEHENYVLTIHHLSGSLASLEYESGYRSYWPLRDFRHATPEEIKAEKERRVFKSVGREVGEFRVGDVVLLGLCEVKFITNTQDAKKAYEHGKVLGFYPIDSLVGLGGDSNETN